MFKGIGTFSVKNRLWVILAWVVLAAVMVFFAPQLKDVARLGEEASLPSGTESVLAKDLLKSNFPEVNMSGSGSIILYNPSGLNSDDNSYAKSLRDWLLSSQAPHGITAVQSVFDDPALEKFLISPDRTVMLMPVTFSGLSMDESTVQAVKQIRKDLPAKPAGGLEVHVSGEAGMSADLIDAVDKGIATTTRVTIVLVIVLLLIIYRSPVAALVPLLTISGAYLVARGLLAYVAQAGVNVWSQIDAYLVVIVFGVGTDYCLFIMSRLREEMNLKNQGDPRITAMEKIGIVITASAATVIVGFLGLMVGRLEMFSTLGPFLAIAVFITLIAALTLTPALASIFGRKLFWPARNESASGRVGAFGWTGIARLVTTKPALAASVVMVVLLIPYSAFTFYQRSFDILGQLPDSMDSVAGFRALANHYDIGEMTPLTAIVVAPQGKNLTDPSAIAALAKVSQSVAAVEGVRSVRSVTQPDIGGQLLTVNSQLDGLSATVGAAAQAIDGPQQAGGPADSTQLLTTVKGYLDELAAAYPQARTNPGYSGALSALVKLNGLLVSSAGQGPPIQEIKATLGSLSANLSGLASDFRGLPDAYLLPTSLVQSNPDLQRLVATFWSKDGRAIKFSIVLKDYPYDSKAFDVSRQARNTLRTSVASSTLSGAQAAVGGPTAEFADVQQVSDADFFRVFAVVLAGVFVVLALLLRSLVAPLYLLLTVLLSYGTTLGISAFVFIKILGQGGISYIVPTFLLVMLIAFGEDYNIFLMSRVKEECQGRTTREGVRIAAGATGGIITACGLILAGTFAALTLTPIQPMVQIGGAIAIGVLIDTFVVRAFLVPAIAATLGRWNWWPTKPKDNGTYN